MEGERERERWRESERERENWRERRRDCYIAFFDEKIFGALNSCRGLGGTSG